MKGKFVMVDGMDGSGKGTMVDGLKESNELRGMKVLDVRQFCREKGRFPGSGEFLEADVLISCEPTYCYVGKAIREELVRKGERKYSGWSLAHAFSLDREILYRSVVLPALKEGRTVIQERGLPSTLVYQPVQERIQISELLRLSGNRLAIENAPSLLIIARASAETVLERLVMREKKDNSIFDNLAFQRKLADRYGSAWLKGLFEQKGSRVEYVDTGSLAGPEDTRKRAVEAVERFLSV